MTDRMIRRFQLEGILIETKMPQVHDSALALLKGMMKDMGWVVLLDVDPVWKTKYLGDDRYDYVLTLQGVYVGLEAASKCAGMLDGKLVPSSRKAK